MDAAPPPSKLTADKTIIGIFADALFRYADENSFASIRGFYDLKDGPAVTIIAVPIGPDLRSLITKATRLATMCARYVEPVVFCPPLATFTNGQHAREIDLQNGLALSVECDTKPTEARATLEALLGPATIIVASGGQWMDPQTGELQSKLHLHWRLNEPTRESEAHKQLKRARTLATSLVGGDASNKPIVHPIRWPGSWHCKAAPRLATIVSQSDNEIDLGEALELLQDAATAAGLDVLPVTEAGSSEGTGEERETAELITAILTAADYHAPLTALSMRMLKGGMTDPVAVLWLRGIMLAVDHADRDMKDGAIQPGRWQARFDDIPRAVRTARMKIDSDESSPDNGNTSDAPSQGDCTDEISLMVMDFNRRYLVVNEAGKAVIFQPGFDPILKRRYFDRMATRDLETLYLNDLVQVGVDEKKRPIWKTKASVWLRHRERRQYIHGVTFDPTTIKSRPGVLNLWQGFAVKPKSGDWSLMRQHIEAVICAGDATRFDYLIRWIACLVQRPAEQGEVAVVMKSKEGAGKGTLAKAILHIIGHHGLAISNGRHLVGNFNAHLRDVIFLFADEALFAGDRAHVGALKSLITEPYLTVEAKYANAVQVPNFLHVMMASNEDWVVPASIESRRFFVLDVPETKIGDHSYFAAIWAQMEAGGYEAMLYDLLAFDLTAFNVRAVPTTEGLQQQRKLSLGTTEAWWLDCLERGYVFKSRLGLEEDLAKWWGTISTELLFASYVEFAHMRGERRPLSREGLGRFFAALKAPPKRWRNGVVGEALRDEDNGHGGISRKAGLVRQDRAHGYSVGCLPSARAAFVGLTGLSITWDSGATDDADERRSEATEQAAAPGTP
jgi:hypothetical protein